MRTHTCIGKLRNGGLDPRDVCIMVEMEKNEIIIKQIEDTKVFEWEESGIKYRVEKMILSDDNEVWHWSLRSPPAIVVNSGLIPGPIFKKIIELHSSTSKSERECSINSVWSWRETFHFQTKTLCVVLKMRLEKSGDNLVLRFIGGPTGFETYRVSDLLDLNCPPYRDSQSIMLREGGFCICHQSDVYPKVTVPVEDVQKFLRLWLNPDGSEKE